MANSDSFINVYKQLEDALEARYRAQGHNPTSVVYQYIGENESAPFRETLDLCRQVRNLITHSANIGDKPPVEPSDGLLEQLRAIVSYVTRPPLAVSRATPFSRLLRATENDRLIWLMKRMDEKGFSHVPVMRGNEIIGVFSSTTPFTMAMESYPKIDESIRIRNIMPLIDVQRHNAERFVFTDPKTTVAQASAYFVRTSRADKRVAALFITENGNMCAPLLGMVTPWDLMSGT